MYNQKVLDLFLNATYAGMIRGATSVGVESFEKTGEVVRIYFSFNDNEILEEVKFKVFGNVLLTALCEAVCRNIEGLSLYEIENLNIAPIINSLGHIEDGKDYLVDLVVSALQDGIDNAVKKLEKKEG